MADRPSPFAAELDQVIAKPKRELVDQPRDEALKLAEAPAATQKPWSTYVPFPAGTELVATAYGPREPEHAVAVDPREVDVVVVPGLAFDACGYRVGFGGGNYDRLLDVLREDAVRIGLCFHQQVVPAVPHGPTDRAVDLVVTDRETIRCRGQAGGPDDHSPAA